MSPKNSVIALSVYSTLLLGGLKLMGVASLTWVMVFFPLWGLAMVAVSGIALVAVIIGAIIS